MFNFPLLSMKLSKKDMNENSRAQWQRLVVKGTLRISMRA
jgi:hypothetical protein